MNKFQILNKDGIAISMNTLDKEAAEFWNVKVDEKSYAKPNDNSMDWYNTVGYAITIQGNYTSGWHNVVTTMLDKHLQGFMLNMKVKDKIELHDINILSRRLETIIKFYQPYVDLVNYWMDKGYTFKIVTD
ncbi:MAG TPA: hypothetical protein PKD00_05655 [Burkholderiales bacterium]|nr:hypothetical protein [Burkholderiales bacterium]